MTGSVVIARGARAAEAALLDAVAQLSAEAREDPALLARPVRVVVPARSLREHVLARIARQLGGVAGVQVQTLHSLAHDVLGRAAAPRRAGGDLLFPLLVRREARREPVLCEALERLRDGYGVVAASASDLLDAGLDSFSAEAVDERLAALGTVAAERARAVARVALRALAALEDAGLEHRAAFFRRAREALERDPETVLPSRAVLVHGYADATGVQADLLAALVHGLGARVIVDWPDKPAEPGSPDPGVSFTERLLLRFGEAGPGSSPRPGAPAASGEEAPAAPPGLLRAGGAQAEARAVAERVRGLLDSGIVPERIGIVVRSLDPYVVPLRTQLRRLGIPFSGAPESGGPLAPSGRRLRALLDLLALGPGAPVDRWLDATDVFPPGERADLRVALHSLGIARVGEAARRDLVEALGGREWLPLPVRRGLVAVSDGAGDAGEEPADVAADESAAPFPAPATASAPLVAARRSVRRAQLETLQSCARAVVTRLAALAGAQTLDEHVSALRSLVADDLGWREDQPARRDLAASLERLTADLAADLALSFEGLVLLLGRALRGAGSADLGGRGAGVAVLSVVEARARTFEHLFLMGMNRDLFPRAVSEDPLLPDEVRDALERDVLPDVPLKRRGFDEERYLFAQLCSSAAHVTLSWQAVTDDGKERTVSPLVERVRLALGAGGGAAEPRDAPPLAPGLFAAPSGLIPAAPRPAHEHAVLAGLYAGRDRFRDALSIALAEGPLLLGLGAAPHAAEVAAARVAVLDEIEPRRRSRTLGPYFGFVGSLNRSDDPRRRDVYVTQLESLARCGWRSFLEGQLRLEPVPDALSELPGVSPRLVGSVLHRVLEAVAREAGVPAHTSLAEARAATPRDVPWPDAARLDALLEAVAREVAREEGLALPGFGRLLAARTRPALERVRSLEFTPDGVLCAVLGVEAEGEIEVRNAAGAARRLRFRADRVDARGVGLRLVDYKAGKPPWDVTSEAALRRHSLAAIAEGLHLQGPAYAWAGGEGRYVFARAGVDERTARVEIDGGDAATRSHFEAALAVLFAARESGSFAPRLFDVKGDKPKACDWCNVSEACVRGDSGARARLQAWRAASEGAAAAGLPAPERTCLDLLRLDEAGRESEEPT